jgi:2-dehydropantoate 2-reductase
LLQGEVARQLVSPVEDIGYLCRLVARPRLLWHRIYEPFDIVWITVKATALDAALEAVPEQDLDSEVAVPLLNGVAHVARLRDRYGHERVLPGTIQVEAERHEPGRVCQLSPFANVEVAPNTTMPTRAEQLCGELRVAGLSCEVQDDEVTMLWGKLCFLAPFALATTASEARSVPFDQTQAGTLA